MNANDIDKAIDFYNQGNSINANCRKFKTTNSTLKRIFINNNVTKMYNCVNNHCYR